MFPLNIGYLAAYAHKFFPNELDIKLFKYPADFIKKCQEKKPDIVGFADYTWNTHVNNMTGQWVKKNWPEVIVIFGGPNITYSDQGYRRFFDTHPGASMFFPYQGETPFINFLQEVNSKGLNIHALTSQAIPGVISYNQKEDTVFKGAPVARISDLTVVPSPYLTGILDEFFEFNIIPIVETNRGCPYSCTFCAQGFSSLNKLNFFPMDVVKDEITYIAKRAKKTNILNLADANFGIVPRDMEIAEHIAKCTKELDYPRNFSTNWAKNQPKLYELCKILKNAKLVVALQSLDASVLENVKRRNIKLDVFRDIMDKVNQEGGVSGTEIILGLPGETKASHIETLRGLFEWDVSFILCYNVVILEGTEMYLQREKGELQCTTKFRLIDNSFGKYGDIESFEGEEGIRSNPTMSEDDILYFRPVHWLIQFLWNYRFYYDVLKYLQSLGLSPLDFILKLVDDMHEDPAFAHVHNTFVQFKKEAAAEWFDSLEDLRAHYGQPQELQKLKEGEYGKMNGKYVFKVLTDLKDEFHQYLYKTITAFSPICKDKEDVFKDLFNFLEASTIDFTQEWSEIAKERTVTCRYDILEWRNAKYKRNLEEFYRPEGITFVFYLPEDQRETLETLMKQYKHTNINVTLRKMSEYMDIRNCFRKIRSLEQPILQDHTLSNKN